MLIKGNLPRSEKRLKSYKNRRGYCNLYVYFVFFVVLIN